MKSQTYSDIPLRGSFHKFGNVLCGMRALAARRAIPYRSPKEYVIELTKHRTKAPFNGVADNAPSEVIPAEAGIQKGTQLPEVDSLFAPPLEEIVAGEDTRAPRDDGFETFLDCIFKDETNRS